MRRIAHIACLIVAASVMAMPLKASELRIETAIDRDLREISQQLRCPVCQGQNLFDSNSGLAEEMRELVREQLREGRSREQIIAYFVDRYGDFVRLAPKTSGPQAILWVWPFAAALVASILLLLALRRRQPEEAGEPVDIDPVSVLEQFEVRR